MLIDVSDVQDKIQTTMGQVLDKQPFYHMIDIKMSESRPKHTKHCYEEVVYPQELLVVHHV